MKHHFTNSELLAIRIYHVLLEGETVKAIYTDMIPSEIQPVEEWFETVVFQRVVTFECDPTLGNNVAEVRVIMRAQVEKGKALRRWKLNKIELVLLGGELVEVVVPSENEIKGEIEKAQEQLVLCTVKQKLRYLMDVGFATFYGE